MAKLTVKQLENLKPSDVGSTLFDGNGLCGKVSNQRSGLVVRFEYRYSLNRRKRYAACGKWPVTGLREIRQKRDRLRQQVDNGIDPVEQRELDRAQHRVDVALTEQRHREELARVEAEKALSRTFTDAVGQWVEQDLKRRKDGGTETLRAIHKDISPKLGNVALADITRASIIDQLDAIVQRGSKVMANHLFADLRQFFNFAVTREWIVVSPLNGVKRSQIGGRPSERDRFLSAGEIVELAKTLPAAKLQYSIECAI